MSNEGDEGSDGELDHRDGYTREDGVEADGGMTRLDAVLKALTHRRRRFTLYYLKDHEIVAVDDLATAIVASETDQPPADVTADRREAVASELVHSHLPKLADAMLVEYDDRSRTVRYTEPNPLLKRLLGLLAKLEPELDYEE